MNARTDEREHVWRAVVGRRLARCSVLMARSLSVAEAKSRFSECVRDAEDGEPVLVTRHGKPVVAIVPVEDLETLQRLRASGPEGGLASVAGRFEDVPEFADELDELVRARSRRRTPRVLEE